MALSEYTQLEYIESTGTQYIDTLIKGNSNTKIELKFYNSYTSSSEKAVFGSRTYPRSNCLMIGFYSNGWVCYNNGEGAFANILNKVTDLKLVKNNMYVLNSSTQQYELVKTYNSGSFTTPSNMILFGERRDNDVTQLSSIKVYHCKIYDEDVLVRDFIPVKRKSDDEICMYDKVTKQFFTNQGTGTFIAGPVVFDGSQLQQNILEIQDLMIQCNDLSLDILGGTPKPDPLKDYKKLEYIQSTGSQYINTDINIGATTDIEVKFITVQAAGGYGRVWGSTSDMKYELADTGGNTGYRISINGTGYSFSTTNDIKIVKMTGNGTVFLNNSQIHNFNKSYTGGEKLWLFWGNSGDWQNVYGRIKLYYAKVWQDNILVRNYIPVLRKEDNKVGLFDIQNNQFYIDVNNGNFTAGPEIN